MANGTADQEMIAVRLNSLLAPLCNQLADLCQCIKDYGQQPGVSPCNSFPFNYKGSLIQTLECHMAFTVFQVPKGQIATITRVSLAERYPGTLYGANLMLMVNDNISPYFPRMDHNVGIGLDSGNSTRICLEEQDVVSILLQCSWNPVLFSGIANSYIETLFPFEMTGYYQYKQVPGTGPGTDPTISPSTCNQQAS